MNLDTVAVVEKPTGYEHRKRIHANPVEEVPEERYNVLEERHDTHHQGLEQVEAVLDEHGIPYEEIHLPYLGSDDVTNCDLVISVGGDGTVMPTAHYLEDDTPVLPVRSDSRSTVGAHCTVNAEDFAAAFNQLQDGDHVVEERTRGEIVVDDRRDTFLNEVGVYGTMPDDTVRYLLQVGAEEERQEKSSGFAVATPAGYTGMLQNYSSWREHLDLDSEADMLLYGMNAEELTHHYDMNRGVVDAETPIRVESEMVDGMIRVDNDRHTRIYEFPHGTTAEITVADQPLHVVNPFPDDTLTDHHRVKHSVDILGIDPRTFARDYLMPTRFDFPVAALHEYADRLREEEELERGRGRTQLADALAEWADAVEEAGEKGEAVWNICKPYMEDELALIDDLLNGEE